MRLARTIVAVMAILLALPGVAAAHSSLATSDPADGSRLDAPPREVVLTFESELRPGGSGFVLTAPDGSVAGEGTLDLDVAERNILRGAVDVSDPGTYTVDWEAVALDGHPESGSLTFAYVSEPAQSGTPDTAVQAPRGANVPAIVGVLLLGAAALASAIRVQLAARHA